MKITDAEASRLTRFLSKGIFDNPENKDVDISIGENAQTGIMRRGHKYYLYIRYNGVIDKQDIFSGFNENVYPDLLSRKLKSLIEHCQALKDVTLNMEKVPMFLQEDENVPENASIVTTEQVPAENVEEAAPSTGQSQGLVPFEEDVLEEERPDKEDVSEETEADNEDVSKNNSLNESLNTQQLSEPYENNILEDLNMTGTTPTENTQIEASPGVKGLMPTEVNNDKLPEVSYLANVIGNDAQMKEKLFKAIDQLILRDKSSAVEFYIRILYRLLPLFNNDISSASEETKLDERDFMLAVYERNYFNN